MPLLSIAVPVYGNASQLDELTRRLGAAVDGVADLDWEIVFVDDASRDDSFQVLTRLAAADARIRGIRLSRNFGSNSALHAAFEHASGDAVVTIAADLQDPPELIPDMVQRWREGAQVVLAARRSRDDPWPTRVFAAIFNRLFRALAFRDYPKGGFDFVLIDRVVADALRAMPEKNSYLFGQVMWLGFRRDTILYHRGRRADGQSAWTFWRKVKYLIDAFTAFSYLPMRLAAVLGFALAGLGFAYAALIVVLRLLGDAQPTGYAALVTIVTVTAGVQLIVTGLVGEYLWRVLEEVRPRPPYVVAERVNAQPPKER